MLNSLHIFVGKVFPALLKNFFVAAFHCFLQHCLHLQVQILCFVCHLTSVVSYSHQCHNQLHLD